MTEIIIRPTNQVPLRFEGSETERWSCEYVNGRQQTRWHEIVLYGIDNQDTEILEIAYHTNWAAETNFVEVHHIEDELTIATLLQIYDPLDHLIGYPEGVAFEKKRQEQQAQITRNWQALKAEVYESLEISMVLKPPAQTPATDLDWSKSIAARLHLEVITEAANRKIPPVEVARELRAFYEKGQSPDPEKPAEMLCNWFVWTEEAEFEYRKTEVEAIAYARDKIAALCVDNHWEDGADTVKVGFVTRKSVMVDRVETTDGYNCNYRLAPFGNKV
jgi:hypothetical protein